MAKKCMSPKAAKWMIGIFSVLLAISLAGLFVFPSLYDKILKEELSLKKGSLASGIWEDIPLPIYEKLYFFNITNGEKFLKNEEPLNVTEVGPYTYVGRWVKPNPVWHPNGTVSYREIRTWHFVREKSIGSQDDIINTLNGPMIIGANMLKQYNIALRIFYSIAMNFEHETVITKKRVRELVYEGYDDPIIEYAPLLKPDIPYKDGKFSWLYGKNATDDGEFAVFDGTENSSLTNIVNTWNRNEKMNFWKADSCNMINGTNIEMGPPQPNVPQDYTFFQSIFCRSITLDYTGDQTHFGVLAKRFELGPKVFANSSENPDNACFEVQGERPSGVLDVSPCQFDAPVIFSFPHFHLADSSYLKNITGLAPDSHNHGSYLDAEQITGVTINISIKFQLNLQMERVRGILQVDNIPEGIFPVFWCDISIQITEEWADYLKGQLHNPKIIAYSVLGTVVVASFVLITVGFVILYLWKKDDENDMLINKKEDKKNNRSNQKVNQAEPTTNYGGISNDGVTLSPDEQFSDCEVTIKEKSHFQNRSKS